jgi:hypothetical protein
VELLSKVEPLKLAKIRVLSLMFKAVEQRKAYNKNTITFSYVGKEIPEEQYMKKNEAASIA